MFALILRLMVPVLILIFLAAILLFAVFYKKPPKKISLPPNYKTILAEKVAFYGRLHVKEKALFEKKIRDFLGNIIIEGRRHRGN